jgi:hypothetical protein
MLSPRAVWQEFQRALSCHAASVTIAIKTLSFAKHGRVGSSAAIGADCDVSGTGPARPASSKIEVRRQ